MEMVFKYDWVVVSWILTLSYPWGKVLQGEVSSDTWSLYYQLIDSEASREQ